MAQSVAHCLGKDLIIGLTHIINSNLTTIYRLFCNFQTIYRPHLELVSKLVSKFQKNWQNYACMAQQVAHSLGKAEVTGSSPVISSIVNFADMVKFFYFLSSDRSLRLTQGECRSGIKEQ